MAGVQAFPVRSMDELVAILKELELMNPAIRMMLEFEVRSGLRYVDVSRIKFKDVMINGVVRESFNVVQSKGLSKRMTAWYKLNPPPEKLTAEYKRKEQQATINARSAATVTINISAQLRQLIEDIHHINGAHELLFQSTHHHARKGRAITIQYINNCLKRVAVKLSLPYPLSTHSMRKSFAMFLLGMNADISVVMKGLGHASLSSTQHYINTFNDSTKAYTAQITFNL